MRPLLSTSSMIFLSRFDCPAADPIHPFRSRLVNSPLLKRRGQLPHLMATPPRGPRTLGDLSTLRQSPSGKYIPETIPASRTALIFASQSFT